MRSVVVMAVVVVACAATAQAAPQRVRGRLQSVDGAPVVSGYIRVKAGETIVLDRAVIVAGRFDLQFDTGAPRVWFEIDAPGFEERTVIVELTGPDVQLNPLKLKPLRGIELGELIHHRIPGRMSEMVDITVANTAVSKDAGITELHLSGTKKAKSQCFDLATPALTLEFSHRVTPTGSPTTVELRVEAGKNQPGDTIAASVRYEVLPCDQRRIDLWIHHELGLRSGQQDKLRIVLPPVAETKDGPDVAIGLDTWDQVVLAVVDRDGRTVKSSGFRKDAP